MITLLEFNLVQDVGQAQGSVGEEKKSAPTEALIPDGGKIRD